LLIVEFIQAVGEVVPLASVGYARDAVGMQVCGDENAKLEKVLIAYEVTTAIIEEAKKIGANLIVAFHPLIFPNIDRLTNSSRTGKLVRDLIKHDIALYVLHTAFDASLEFGTSRLMAEVLELESIEALEGLKNSLNKIVVYAPHLAASEVREALAKAGAGVIGNYESCTWQVEGRGTFRGNDHSNPAIGEKNLLESVDEVRIEMVCETWRTSRAVKAMIAAHPYEEVAYDIFTLANGSMNFGMGAVGHWPEQTSVQEALGRVRAAFGTPMLRHSSTSKQTVKRVAMLGGSGMEYYSAALRSKADMFITADIRYHDFYRATHDNIVLVDAGHAETERFVPQGMLRAIRKALARARGVVTSGDDHPVSLLAVSHAEPNAVRYF
jgi:dinuclear metal center YbgI/SA1388 family protein